MPTLEVSHLTFTYLTATRPSLNDVSFSVEAGEMAAVIGANNSGKSTLCYALSGVVPTFYRGSFAGSVVVEKLNTLEWTISELAQKVGLVMQISANQLSGLRDSVFEEVAFVAMDTPIVVFDEPTAGMDVNELRLFKAVLDKLQQEKKTVIIISHDMDFVAEQIGRVVCLKNGKILFDGSSRTAFLKKDLLASCNLHQPQIARLSTYFELDELALTPGEFVQEFHHKIEKQTH